jgi:hypothetical protein
LFGRFFEFFAAGGQKRGRCELGLEVTEERVRVRVRIGVREYY